MYVLLYYEYNINTFSFTLIKCLHQKIFFFARMSKKTLAAVFFSEGV